ncbi:MAG: response regulator transcription factor [Bacteroidota bacterium]
MIKIAIIEINAVYRRKLAYFLEHSEGVQLIHKLQNCKNMVLAFTGNLPDVVVMSIDYPGMVYIKQHWPSVKILVLTVFNEVTDISTSISSGADGYLLKSDPAATIIELINAVYSGGHGFSKEIRGKISAHFKHFSQKDDPTPNKGYSKRESSVLALLQQGYCVAAIANHCQCTTELVNTVMKSLYIKLSSPKS